MKTKSSLALWCCVLIMCSCNKPSVDDGIYNPGHAPLTADEVATLLDLYHWKITQTPDDGKPYWGVRIVVANRGFATVGDDPPYRMIHETGIVPFAAPLDPKGNPQILLGIQIGSEGIKGQINATSPKYTDTIRFHIPKGYYSPGPNGGGSRICSGASWKDNRVDLIEFLGSDDRIASVVCLEFLHARPGN